MKEIYKKITKNGKSERLHRIKLKEKGIDLRNKDVHHKDGNKNNNNISNLEALSHSEHTAITNKETKVSDRKCSIKGCGRKHYAKGLCKYHYNKVLRKKIGK